VTLIDTPSGTDRAAIASRREALRTAHAVVIVYDLSAGENRRPPKAAAAPSASGSGAGDAVEGEGRPEDEEDTDEAEAPKPTKHGSLGRVRSAWLPVVRATARRGTPVVLAGTKLDLVSPTPAADASVPPPVSPGADAEAGALAPSGSDDGAHADSPDAPTPSTPSDDAVAELQAAQAAVMAKDGGIEVIVICSPVTTYNVAAVFHYATASVIYPSGPLYHDSSPVLRPRAVAALHAIFHACDVDADGLLSDAEMGAFQSSCLNEPLTADGVSTVKETLAASCPAGIRPLPRGGGGTGVTPGGFVALHTMIARNGRLDTLWRVVRSHGYDNSLRRVGAWDPARGLPAAPAGPPGGRGGVARVWSPPALAFLRRAYAGLVDAAAPTVDGAAAAGPPAAGAVPAAVDAAFAGCPVHPFRRSLVGGDLAAGARGDASPHAGGGGADVEAHWEEGAPWDTRGWVGSRLESLVAGPVDESARMTVDAWVAAWGVALATDAEAATAALAHLGYCSVLCPCAEPVAVASPSGGGKHGHKGKEPHKHHHVGGAANGAAAEAAAAEAGGGGAAVVDPRRPPPPVLLTSPRRKEVEAEAVVRPLLVAYLFGGPGAGKTQVARALVSAPYVAAPSTAPGAPTPLPLPHGERPTTVGGVWVDVEEAFGGGRRLLVVREVASGRVAPTLAAPELDAADVGLLVFDAADADSLDVATSIHRRLVAAAPRLPIIFVAAKADLLDGTDSDESSSTDDEDESEGEDDAVEEDDDSPAALRHARRVRRRARRAVVADADAYCDAEGLPAALRVAAVTGEPEDGAEVAGQLVGVALHPALACPRLLPGVAAAAAEAAPKAKRPPGGGSAVRSTAIKAVVAATAVAVTVVVAKKLYTWYMSRPPAAASS